MIICILVITWRKRKLYLQVVPTFFVGTSYLTIESGSAYVSNEDVQYIIGTIRQDIC